jgi:predicted nucleic acid-binding protein
MEEIFADTSYWIALQWQKDSLFPVARTLTESLPPTTRIVTSDLVLVEFLNYACSIGLMMRIESAMAWDDLYSDPGILVLPTSPELLQAAAQHYRKNSDKFWSLTDCVSFLIMQERKIHDALTYDHHFEQAGFRALMRQ